MREAAVKVSERVVGDGKAQVVHLLARTSDDSEGPTIYWFCLNWPMMKFCEY
jgi:hypothetical protein